MQYHFKKEHTLEDIKKILLTANPWHLFMIGRTKYYLKTSPGSELVIKLGSITEHHIKWNSPQGYQTDYWKDFYKIIKRIGLHRIYFKVDKNKLNMIDYALAPTLESLQKKKKHLRSLAKKANGEKLTIKTSLDEDKFTIEIFDIENELIIYRFGKPEDEITIIDKCYDETIEYFNKLLD